METRYDTGMATRRAVLGVAHLDRTEATRMQFDAPFRTLITEGLGATGNFAEIPMRVRATANTGATMDDVMQAFLHVATFAGMPKANHAIRLAKTTCAEMEEQDA